MSFEAHGRRHFELVLLDGELPGDGLTSGEKSRELTCVTDKGMAELEQREAERVAKGKKKEKKREREREIRCHVSHWERREREEVPRVTLGEQEEERERKREMRSNRGHRKREEKERGRDKGEA